MTQKKTVCFGLTLFNRAKYLSEALISLLNQSYSDFYIVAIDDASTDETAQIIKEYAAKDKRITYFRNPERLGLIATWRLTLLKAIELHNPYYFAWASDHDRWDPDWLKIHLHTLNEYPEVVLAYPKRVGISTNGALLPEIKQEPFETFDLSYVDHLHHLCTNQSSAGDAVYGLFRVKSLIKAGGFRNVIMPDRLLITEIGIYGKIKQIDQVLWYRRYFDSIKTHEQTVSDQRKNLFGGNSYPLHSYTPFLSHVLSILIHVSLLPSNGDRSNFWRGMLMSGLLWEKYYKNFISKELKDLSDIPVGTAEQLFSLSVDEKEIGITKKIELISQSLTSQGDKNVSGVTKWIQHVVAMGFMMDGDRKIIQTNEDFKKKERTVKSEIESWILGANPTEQQRNASADEIRRLQVLVDVAEAELEVQKRDFKKNVGDLRSEVVQMQHQLMSAQHEVITLKETLCQLTIKYENNISTLKEMCEKTEKEKSAVVRLLSDAGAENQDRFRRIQDLDAEQVRCMTTIAKAESVNRELSKLVEQQRRQVAQLQRYCQYWQRKSSLGIDKQIIRKFMKIRLRKRVISEKQT